MQLSPVGTANSTSFPPVPRAINGAIPNLSAETHFLAGPSGALTALVLPQPLNRRVEEKLSGLLTDAASLASVQRDAAVEKIHLPSLPLV